MHAGAWLDRLARSDGEPRDRLLAALDELAPDAATVFTPLDGEAGTHRGRDPGRTDDRARGPLARLDRARSSPTSTCRCRRRRATPSGAGSTTASRLPLAVGRVHLGPPRRPGSDLVSEAGIQIGVARARSAAIGGRVAAVAPRRRRGGRPRGTQRGDGPGAADALRGRPRDRPPRRRRARRRPRSGSRSCRPSSAARRSSSSRRRSPSGSAAFGRPVEVDGHVRGRRGPPSGSAPPAAPRSWPPASRHPARIAARRARWAHRPRATRPVPALRLAPNGPRERLRADPVPDHPLLRRLPPAVRSDQIGLMGERAPASSGDGCRPSSASSAPGRWAPGSRQVALEAGYEVVLYDVDEAAIERGRERIRDGLTRRARRSSTSTRGRPTTGSRRGSTACAHVPTVDGLADEADLVIECGARGPRAEADDLPDARRRRRRRASILATNTSALSVADDRRGDTPPGPRPRPPLLQSRRRSWPSSRSSRRRCRIPASSPGPSRPSTAWGKTPVVCADRPGFIVNRVNRPFTIEALRILESGARRRDRGSTRRSATAASRWARSS